MGGAETGAFRVIWQGPDRTFWRVAWLRVERDDTGDIAHRFGYEPEAHLPSDFTPFLAFPDLRGEWESPELFPFFANRVLSPRAPNYSQHVHELGLSEAQATPVELLTRTLGRRGTDTVQVVPAPVMVSDGFARQRFLVSGVRHVAHDRRPDVSQAIERLRPGTELRLEDDYDNEADARAVLIDDEHGPLGWVPQYLLDELRKARDIDDSAIRCLVVHANGPDAPWHVRLMCDLVRPALDTDEHSLAV